MTAVKIHENCEVNADETNHRLRDYLKGVDTQETVGPVGSVTISGTRSQMRSLSDVTLDERTKRAA